MSKTFDQGRAEIAKLCGYFDTNLDAFHAPGVKEAQIRQNLIDPLFEALGWDVRNAGMVAPQYREVISEVSLDVEGQQKAPDYAFRVGPLPKFYAEAKKCGVNIHADPAPAFQLRRYGWSGKVAVSILTDFEELGVYDCTTRPNPTDKASHARILYFGYKEYPDRWRELWDVFSRDAVWSGAFDQYAASKRKRGTSEVDVEFLKEIEGWREDLARNMALRNSDLSSDDLNAAVQRTIDRVVFLRMAEDRGLEPYEQLLKLCERPDIYARFMRDLCRKTDEKYNLGLFHFQNEPDVSEAPDRITPKLSVDDKVFKPILESLYFAHGSPYHFGVLPVEILGTVYERFLGKVIRLTAGHQAKIEEKPEVRKAGGVYYTPASIVAYIVKHTVGTQIDGKSPAQLAVGRDKAPFRVLDMACGSGSFLLGAYQYLLDHCLKWYIEHKPDANKKAVFEDPRSAQWRLTIEEKKRILTTHLFGVDIDPQAVEVSKLSLLLKALEGETDATLSLQLKLFHDRALPNLADNIKCGNSLIGPDYFVGNLIPDSDEIKRVNAFDWTQGFPDALKAGGFDAVIGNPPYGFHQIHSAAAKPYFKAHFAASEGSYEHYFLFYEASLKLLRQRGRHGFIVPVTWLTIPSAAGLRRFVLREFALRSIAWLPELVFKGAQVNTLVSIIERSLPATTRILISEVNDPEKDQGIVRQIKQSRFIEANETILIFEDNSETKILSQMARRSVPLKSIARPCSGYNPYEVGTGIAPDGKPHTKTTVEEKPYHSTRSRGRDWKPEAVGRDLGRYSLCWPTARFVKYGPWLAAARDPDNFVGPRIIVQEITGGLHRRIVATFCDRELYHSRDIIPIKCDSEWPQPLFLLGIINSWLISWRHHRRSPKGKKALFPKVLVGDLKTLPVPALDPNNTSDCNKHDRMVALVSQMLALHERLDCAKSAAQEGVIQRQIEAVDQEIDRFVYKLFGLTAAEIAIVEGKDGAAVAT